MRAMFCADVSEAEAGALAGGALMLLPPAGNPVPLALARDSAILSAAEDALPRWLNAHRGDGGPGPLALTQFWVKCAADVAHRSGS